MPVDFIVITPMPEERDAVLDQLPGYEKVAASHEDIRVYYRAEIPLTVKHGTACYRVVVVPLTSMGHTQAATSTNDAIRRWQPRNVLLVGIAGGIAKAGVNLGDVLIADQVADYERQKVKDGIGEPRWQVYPVDQRLLIEAQNFTDRNWPDCLSALRPTSGRPKVHFGPICTGNKVWADESLAAQYRDVWSKLVGVEMEAGGVANAALQSGKNPGFFMIRGVSDLADKDKDANSTRVWREYACRVAAAYTIAFLRTAPVPVAANAAPTSESHNDTRMEARRKLAAISVPYSREEFLSRIKEHDSDAVQLFLDSGMDPDDTLALWEAVHNRYTDIVRLLVKKGVPRSIARAGKDLLPDAVRQHNLQLVEAILEHSKDLDSHTMALSLELSLSWEKDHPEVVRALSARSALISLEKRGQLLAQAAKAGSRFAVEAMLAAGADPNAKLYEKTDIMYRVEGEKTALTYAVEKGDLEIVKTLLAGGADPNLGRGSFVEGKALATNIMIAALHGRAEILEALLEKGADATAKTPQGATALMLAAGKGSEACVRTLLIKGVDPASVNVQGATARTLAEKTGHYVIAKILADAEGVPYQILEKPSDSAPEN
jgi:nucleoside phosphorylase/ankyrin repeat protein